MKAPTLSNDNPAGDPSVSGSDQILQWFTHYIKANNIKIGDPLPIEDDIVNATKLSRTCVREALTRYRALGIISSRRRRGMRLSRSPDLLELTKLLDETSSIPPETIGHLGGLRSALELGMESEIFSNASSQHIAELRQIFEQMVQVSEKVDQWNELDLKFHEHLIRITGNKVAIWLSQLFRPFFLYIRGHQSSMSEVTREKHRRIVAALEDNDPVAFHLALREHHLNKLSWRNYDALGSVPPRAHTDHVASAEPKSNGAPHKPTQR